MTAISWLPWTAASFTRAREEGKPVLLSLAPTWCRNSLAMDAASYQSVDVASVANSRFIPVRVDADRRPDIAERYNLGGWPTTAFLTAEGAILGGGTFVDATRLRQVLERVHQAYATGRHVGRVAVTPATTYPTGAPTVEELVRQVNGTFDRTHGGYGHGPKFPHVGPVRMALELFRTTGDTSHRDMAVTTLDAMGWGPLYDERDGGFFRYAQHADWSSPNEEKLLDVNATLLALYLDGFEILQHARYAERAEDILRYVQTWLADSVDAGWSGSQRADAEYYTLRGSDHPAAVVTAPPVDTTLFTDWNALMASAALKAGRVLNDPSLSEFAVRSLERITLLCYQPGGGIAHFYDGGPQVRGLLDDHVTMATAQLDAFEATANIVYEMLAEELALHAVQHLWDETAGGFFDRTLEPDDVGLLRERYKPFALNCAAARMLRRLSRLSKKPRYAAVADLTMAAMAGQAGREGALAAEYVLAVMEAGG
jgi:uncharacterized protein